VRVGLGISFVPEDGGAEIHVRLSLLLYLSFGLMNLVYSSKGFAGKGLEFPSSLSPAERAD
jgi:hypothetical protein